MEVELDAVASARETTSVAVSVSLSVPLVVVVGGVAEEEHRRWLGWLDHGRFDDRRGHGRHVRHRRRSRAALRIRSSTIAANKPALVRGAQTRFFQGV